MQYPQHIAIIMDGNGRWAKRRRLPRFAGHQQGVESVRAVIKACLDRQIPVLTLFAFSSENWERPPQEVSFLMSLFLQLLEQEVDQLHENQVRLRFIGERSALNEPLQRLMSESEAKTKHNLRLQLNLAINYGGRWDIVEAAKKVARAAQEGRIHLDTLNEHHFHQYTSLAELPPVDFFIRTSGELRLSNFLLWQMAYTELYFAETLWPDFRLAQFEEALCDFAQRERRFGVVEAEVVS